MLAGSTASPGGLVLTSCPPAHLVAVGRTLQMQTSAAPPAAQTPALPADKGCAALLMLCVRPRHMHPHSPRLLTRDEQVMLAVCLHASCSCADLCKQPGLPAQTDCRADRVCKQQPAQCLKPDCIQSPSTLHLSTIWHLTFASAGTVPCSQQAF